MMLSIPMTLDVVNEDESDNETNYYSNRSHTKHIFFAFGVEILPNISSI